MKNDQNNHKKPSTLKNKVIGALGGIALMAGAATFNTGCAQEPTWNYNPINNQTIENTQVANPQVTEPVTLLEKELLEHPFGSRPDATDERIYYKNNGDLIHSYVVNGQTEEVVVKAFEPGLTYNKNRTVAMFCSATGEISYYNVFMPAQDGDQEYYTEVQYYKETNSMIPANNDGFTRRLNLDQTKITVTPNNQKITRESQYAFCATPLLEKGFKDFEKDKIHDVYYDTMAGNLCWKKGNVTGVVNPGFLPGLNYFKNYLGENYTFCTTTGEITYYDKNGKQVVYNAETDTYEPYISRDGITRQLNLQTQEIEVSVGGRTQNVQQNLGREM